MTAPDTRLVGVLGGGRRIEVDRVGTLRPERVHWELAWWIGADDRWHFPEEEVAVRQSTVDGMPVVTTAMRVPGGDAVHRVYGATSDATVVELSNDSRAPFVLALVVRGAASVDADGPTVFVDNRAALIGARPPARWAVSGDGTTRGVVVNGEARSGAFVGRHDRAARLEAAFLFPVAHGAYVRFLLPVDPRGGARSLDAPDADQVARGWRAQLERGMRVDLPDSAMQLAVDAARAQILLEAEKWITRPEVVMALEDWGFDDEARTAWTRLGVFARRAARRRPRIRASWDDVSRHTSSGEGAALLNALRSVLLAERANAVSLVADWPEEWRGRSLDVRGAPTRAGPVSYSLRWHGERVALFWDVPPNLAVRIPAFDRDWVTREPRGEALLEVEAGDQCGS